LILMERRGCLMPIWHRKRRPIGHRWQVMPTRNRRDPNHVMEVSSTTLSLLGWLVLVSGKLPMQMVIGTRHDEFSSKQRLWLCGSPRHTNWTWSRCCARASLPCLGGHGSCCGGRRDARGSGAAAANGMRLKLQQGTNLNADHYWNCCVFRRRNLLAWDIRKNANEVPCTWSSRLYPGCPWFNAQVSATHSRRKGPKMASDSMAVVHPFGSRRLDQPSSLGHLHEIASPIAQRKALTSSRSSA